MSSDALNIPSKSFANVVVAFCLVTVPVGFAVMALAVGQDANWDLRNYHWYNPYAFLNGRLALDLGVAHVATFYNPILDLPTYLAGRVLPARVMGAILGFIHGLNFLLLYSLACRSLAALLPAWEQMHRRLAALVLGFVGMVGGGHLSLVGTTYNDNVVSLAVLGALLIVMSRSESLFSPVDNVPRGPGWTPVILAGALIGLAVGLKLPTAIFAVGLCGAFLCVGGSFRRRFMLAFVFGLAVVVGFAVADGPWMWRMWRDYANPLFPYFNNFFHSPMGMADNNYRDTRFIPRGALSLLQFPLTFSLHPLQTGEVSFRDYRILAAYGVLLVSGVLTVLAWLRIGPRPAESPPVARYLVAATILTYVPWLLVFAIYRYIVALEMLAPLVIVITLIGWPLAPRLKMILAVAVLIVVTITAQRGEWVHRPWQDGPFVTASAPPVEHSTQTLALITGIDPVGWLLPFFPPQIPFIRLQGYLNAPGQSQNGLNDAVRDRIAAHTGDMFLLTAEYEFETAAAALGAYNLGADFANCLPVPSNLGDYARWCRVYHLSEDSAAAPPSHP